MNDVMIVKGKHYGKAGEVVGTEKTKHGILYIVLFKDNSTGICCADEFASLREECSPFRRRCACALPRTTLSRALPS